ncbi:MAG: TolC family protein [Anaeromyxobacter sp.]
MNLTCLAALLALTAAAQAPAPPAAGAGAPGPAVLTLAQALEELDRQSLSLVQARSRAAEASGLARQALAPLLPSLAVGASWVQNSDDAVMNLPGTPPRVIPIQPLHSATASASARLPLVEPSAWFDLAAARDAARAADLGASATRLTLRTGFAQAAHQAAATEELVSASERAVENAAELTRSAERRVAAGTAAPLDALRARTELVKRQSDLADARAGLDKAELALGILLGRPAPVRVTVPDVGAQPDPAPTAQVEPLEAEALAHRPELAATQAQVEAAQAGVRSAWARLAPQLSASASVFRSDTLQITEEYDGWRATLDLSWPLYDGGFRYGKRRQAEAQLTGARAGAEAQRLAVVQEVRDAARDLEVARERLRLAGTQRDLAAETRASAQRSFDAGIASSLDVIDANDRLFQAETGLAGARARLAAARLALLRALGREA